jgi:hypothetical protein
MHEGLVPDVSLGTHFFSDLVETDILYLAIFPQRHDNRLNAEWLRRQPNRLAEILPPAAEWARCVQVIDLPNAGCPEMLRLNANTLQQRVFCYLEAAEAGGGTA